MAREVCEICGGTGIAVQPIAYEDAAGTVQHAVSRIACWGCDYGKRHTLSELDALNTERERGAAAMARDEASEQQAMTAERLAEIRAQARALAAGIAELDAERESTILMIHAGLDHVERLPLDDTLHVTRIYAATISELLAEVERLRAREAAKADSYERLHLINMQLGRISRARQADLVAEREQAMEIVRAVANQDCAQDIDDPEWMQCLACGGGGPTGDSIEHHEICYYVKARALLASAGEQRSSGEE